MYLRKAGWTDSDRFSIQTAAGEIRPHITGPDDLHARHGPRAPRRRTTSPRATHDGAGTLTAQTGATWRFQHVQVGNPQCAIHLRRRERARRARPPEHRPGDHGARAVPQPHERQLVRRARARRHPRAHLRARRGGDDVLRHRRQRRRRRLRPARRRLARDRAPRRRRARRRRRGGPALQPRAAGRVPVYRGELADDFHDQLENL